MITYNIKITKMIDINIDSIFLHVEGWFVFLEDLCLVVFDGRTGDNLSLSEVVYSDWLEYEA